ncbi:hypothetical protein ACFL6Z_00265 [Pseudomonadota bacterium]|uniref:hypothetical protein n=1 Tax=unclassified Shewanella TaxID=196818 RepID=UPI000C8510F7|nr:MULTISPECIES: hypothetical protein [unclassified Shewanella]MDO6618741.1 hypothetical protein [Shewanella sp. 6_MG-2023]MDO6639816.1 hypothetical protein [Shewanella sp. 5_MG-2023]PMG31865.1 hypothetical protein BCU94_06730 [Shewanella sp. 10N.286.52.C2]PMH85276.1 hypothetical protein BCU57_14830 [Shewanella sp. 10N.286.48.B5]PMH98180.1 hypothetical protein BCU55_16425 [Shewanella sp. 10N.286.48.A6]
MFDKKMCGLMMLGLSSLTLMGCDSSDSDDNSETDSAYIQFYNASANSTATSLVMDEYEYTSVAFSDSMPRYSYATGSVTMEIYGSDENGDSSSIYSEDMDLDKEENHLFVLYGDYHSPELLKVIYDRADMDDLNSDEDNEYSKMQVLVANVTAEEMAFDAYISLDTDSYADATMIGSVDYRGVTSELMLDTDDYIVYLTDKGTDNVVYTTSSMSLTTETVYKFMIRNSFGSGDLKVVIDSVDSTTTPTSYTNIDATADFRVFNGLEQRSLDVDVISKAESHYLLDIAPFTVSDYQQTGFNDYGVSVTDSATAEILLDNVLVTFNQDDVRTLLLYQDDTIKGMVIEHDLRPRAFENNVDIVNLSQDYDDLSVYFVRSSETIESAEYSITDLDFTDQDSLVLLHDNYEVNVVYESDNGTKTLLYQSDFISFDGESNYSFVLMPDSSSSFGYNLVQL